jgi:hypothetical protein
MKQTCARWLGLACAVAVGSVALAHVGHLPSVHDVVAGVIDRIGRELPDEAIRRLTAREVEALLTPEELEVLSSRHVVFRVDVPVVVTVLRDVNLTGEPFWLEKRGFKSIGVTVERDGSKFEAWEREFGAGEIGLGVNSLRGGGLHYLVLVRPVDRTQRPVIDQLYPGQLRVEEWRPGIKPYVDRDESFAEIPAGFDGKSWCGPSIAGVTTGGCWGCIAGPSIRVRIGPIKLCSPGAMIRGPRRRFSGGRAWG